MAKKRGKGAMLSSRGLPTAPLMLLSSTTGCLIPAALCTVQTTKERLSLKLKLLLLRVRLLRTTVWMTH